MRLAFLASIVYSVTLFGGVNVGNSGYGVVCTNPDTGEKTVRLYDHYQHELTAKSAGWLKIPKQPSEFEGLEWVLENFKRYDGKTAKKLESSYESMIDHIVYVKGPLPLIPDTGSEEDIDGLTLPHIKDPFCHVLQLAIQGYVSSETIEIDTYWYDKLPLRDKIGLLLHELLYRNAKDRFRNNLVREMTVLMMSQSMDPIYRRIGAKKFYQTYAYQLFHKKKPRR